VYGSGSGSGTILPSGCHSSEQTFITHSNDVILPKYDF
jgi:hypothetical protein